MVEKSQHEMQHLKIIRNLEKVKTRPLLKKEGFKPRDKIQGRKSKKEKKKKKKVKKQAKKRKKKPTPPKK
jgi:hypothetical protein